MPTVRYLVHDVDAVLPFYEALGFRQVDRWGPPFAILERQGLALWLSAPGTSAARAVLAGGAGGRCSAAAPGPAWCGVRASPSG